MVDRFRKSCFTFALVLMLGVVARADNEDNPSFECRWAPDPIKIDGKADEPAWATAQMVDKFRRAWEREGEP